MVKKVAETLGPKNITGDNFDNGVDAILISIKTGIVYIYILYKCSLVNQNLSKCTTKSYQLNFSCMDKFRITVKHHYIFGEKNRLKVRWRSYDKLR